MTKKETDRGIEIKEKEYTEIIRDEEFSELRNQYKVPFSCICGNLMDNWSTSYFYKWGVCADCYINYLESRNLPDEIMKSQSKAQAYVIEKIKEKQNPLK